MEMGGEQLSDHEIRATLPFRVIFIHFCRVSFDLLWETTFLYSCLELFVDTGYVQGTEKMIMRGAFVEASSRRGGEGFWTGVWQDALFWSDTRRKL